MRKGTNQDLTLYSLQQTEDHIFDALCVERQQAINADHPMVQDFWELYDYLNDDGAMNHSKNGAIALNLNHFVAEADRRRQQMPPLADLKRVLKTSKARKYLGQRAVSSKLWDSRDAEGMAVSKTVKCWVFQEGG